MPYKIVWERTTDWSPLEAVAALLEEDDIKLELGLFMHMGCVVNQFGHQIFLFKHVDTRCYLNLDEAGHAYRFLIVDVDGQETYDYEPYGDLLTGVMAVLTPDRQRTSYTLQ